MSDLQRQEFHQALLDADAFEDLRGHGGIQRAVSMSRRLPREMRRELRLASAPDSGGCLLAFAPDSRGPGLAARDRAAERWLAVALDTRRRRASAPGSGGSGLSDQRVAQIIGRG
jgi:hypothetical protein